MRKKKFATAINSMDGRAQKPVIDWMMSRFGVDFVDMITTSGPTGKIVDGSDQFFLDSLKLKLDESINLRHSSNIAVVAYIDCVGSPKKSETTQKKEIAKSVKIIQSWYPTTQVIGLWIDSDLNCSKVGIIDETG